MQGLAGLLCAASVPDTSYGTYRLYPPLYWPNPPRYVCLETNPGNSLAVTMAETVTETAVLLANPETAVLVANPVSVNTPVSIAVTRECLFQLLPVLAYCPDCRTRVTHQV